MYICFVYSTISYRHIPHFCSTYIHTYKFVLYICRPENPSPIVVYGNSTPECTAHIDWLACKLEQLKKDRKVLAKVEEPSHSEEYEWDDSTEDKPFDYFQHFCHTIADGAKEIWILDDGYEAFQKEYPFLCGHVDWSNMFPLPHQVNRNLFLGTRVFPLEKDCLRKLEITHVIVSEFQKINWSELDGISVLRCSVKDKNDQSMLPCWKACYQFITEALAGAPNKEQSTSHSEHPCLTVATGSDASHSDTQVMKNDAGSELPDLANLRISSSSCQSTSPEASTDSIPKVDPQLESADDRNKPISPPSKPPPCGVRILVLLHGRSRSSSVILAYLIKAYRMNFGEAWTYLCSKCWHIIDRSLVYVDQLKHWEQTELASIEEF